MNASEFQKKLDMSWAELIEKKRKDIKFEGELAGIKVNENYWFTLSKKNLPGIIINLDQGHNFGSTKFPKGKGWSFIINKNKIFMNVNEEKYKEFFIKLINLILKKIFLEKLSGEKSVNCFLSNLFSAKDFFEEDNVPRKLTHEKQIGLFGELYVLSKIITKRLNNDFAIKSWTGPSKKHDFTFENKLIEIKTTKTDTKKINTSSTNQIAPVYERELNLIFLQIKSSNIGLSLNDIIDEYLSILNEESESLKNDFILKLTQSNYLDMHKEEYNQKYKIDKINFFYISNNFPYIKSVEHGDEISELDITYKIDLEKCEDFRINEEELISNL